MSSTSTNSPPVRLFKLLYVYRDRGVEKLVSPRAASFALSNHYHIPTHHSFHDTCRWEFGVGRGTNERNSNQLCGPGMIHAYRSPFQARLYYARHVPELPNVHLFQAEAPEVIASEFDKVGVHYLTVFRDPPVRWWLTDEEILRLVHLPRRSSIQRLYDTYEGLSGRQKDDVEREFNKIARERPRRA